jgi:hypothetical protein
MMTVVAVEAGVTAMVVTMVVMAAMTAMAEVVVVTAVSSVPFAVPYFSAHFRRMGSAVAFTHTHVKINVQKYPARNDIPIQSIQSVIIFQYKISSQ